MEPVWKSVLKRHYYKAELIRLQRFINLKMAKVYRTVSNEALCIINGIISINIKIEEIAELYEITKRVGTQYDNEMENENWKNPAIHVKIIERNADSPHYIQAYTDGSKSEAGVGAGIAIYQDNNLTSTLKYRLNETCTNNQAEQMAILKALEHIQSMESCDMIVLIHTESQITLQLLKKNKKNTRLIERIRTKII